MKIPRSLVLAVTLAACATFEGPSQVTPIQAAGTWQHQGSGLSFPDRIGEFTRAGIHQFDRPGTIPSIGVGYNCETWSATVAFTVYVAPPLQQANGQLASLAAQFGMEKDTIRERHDGATESWSHPATLVRDGRSFAGFAAEYRYTEEFAQRVQPVISQLYVFESGDWFLKYRITFAAVQDKAARAAVEALLRSAPWGALATQRT